jgi:hypothetical protein
MPIQSDTPSAPLLPLLEEDCLPDLQPLEVESTLPKILEILLTAMKAHGLTELVLQSMDALPSEPPPEATGLLGEASRPALLQGWLRAFYLLHAPTTTLVQELTSNPEWMPLDVIEELLQRQAPEVEKAVVWLVETHGRLFLRPLLTLAPEKADALLKDRLAHVKEVRAETGEALDACVREEHLPLIRYLRKQIAELPYAEI